MFLKGQIYLTDNLDVIHQFPIDPLHRIINMDEDDVLPETNYILQGTCLLPPIDAKIAEADGDERKYDAIYSSHLLAPYQQEFISAILAYLYKGGEFIIFLTELGYNETRNKFIEHMFRIYGIHIGVIGDPNPQNANCYYDERCIPIWLNMIFTAKVIGPEEYLSQYPIDAPLNNTNVLNLLVEEMNPIGRTYDEKIKYILQFHKRIHKYPNIHQVLEGIYT